MLTVNTNNFDHVINSHYLTGFTNYEFAITKLYPLINHLSIQRKLQSEKFYKRLETDLANGCIIPPLTMAIISKVPKKTWSNEEFETFINKNIKDGFILDGIQRLNTLKRVHDRKELNIEQPIFLNIIICASRDNLLYRMVTLNNGQKPMTARHQIEILASSIYDFKKLGIDIITEKETATKRPRSSFKKADIISSYIAYLAGSISLESTKIIEEKMDELIARRIIDSQITSDGMEFGDVVKEIARFSNDDYLFKWFKNLNNLVGFSVGIKSSFSTIKSLDTPVFKEVIEIFEKAFSFLDVSQIKLSRERRKLSQYLIANINDLKNLDADELLMKFNEQL